MVGRKNNFTAPPKKQMTNCTEPGGEVCATCQLTSYIELNRIKLFYTFSNIAYSFLIKSFSVFATPCHA